MQLIPHFYLHAVCCFLFDIFLFQVYQLSTHAPPPQPRIYDVSSGVIATGELCMQYVSIKREWSKQQVGGRDQS